MLFSISQRIFGKIQSNDLQRTYETNAGFAPALVPLERVVDAFERLFDANVILLEAQHVVDYYFKDTWIGCPHRRQHRRRTQFSLEVSNYFEGVQQHLPKTNNSIER